MIDATGGQIEPNVDSINANAVIIIGLTLVQQVSILLSPVCSPLSVDYVSMNISVVPVLFAACSTLDISLHSALQNKS